MGFLQELLRVRSRMQIGLHSGVHPIFSDSLRELTINLFDVPVSLQAEAGRENLVGIHEEANFFDQTRKEIRPMIEEKHPRSPMAQQNLVYQQVGNGHCFYVRNCEAFHPPSTIICPDDITVFSCRFYQRPDKIDGQLITHANNWKG